MRLRRALSRAVNLALQPAGLAVTALSRDFDVRLDNPAQLARMHKAFAAIWREWVGHQVVMPVRAEVDVERAASMFYEAYLSSPFRHQVGGSRYNNLLLLFLMAKSSAPAMVVDSGTFTGASAWALRLGAPSARVLSFDLDLSRLLSRTPEVEYYEHDWAAFDFTGLPVADALCYFDDHIDQVRRLLEARKRGFRFAVFDDDFPLTSFAPMAGDGSALPKIEFVLDPELRGEKELSWIAGGRRRRWIIDHAYLDRARETISATDRLPNTSHITGIHQTPYRLVALTPAG